MKLKKYLQLLKEEAPNDLPWEKEEAQDGEEYDSREEYFDDEDPVGRWIEERFEQDHDSQETLKDIWEDWEAWCLQNGEKRGTNKRLAQLLLSKGFKRGRLQGSGLTTFEGLALKAFNMDEATRILAKM